MGTDLSMAQLAERVRTALETADLGTFADLLAPDVTWGAPGDPSPSCRNRGQVLKWYEQGRAAGRRAAVVDVATYPSKILVTLSTSDGPSPTEPTEPTEPTAPTAPTAPTVPTANRWQVLTVADGRVSDIRGYDDRDAAIQAASAG